MLHKSKLCLEYRFATMSKNKALETFWNAGCSKMAIDVPLNSSPLVRLIHRPGPLQI